MRREPLHGPPAIVGDVGLCERPRRESQRDGEDDQRREAAAGDEDRLDPARARATQTRGQAANADRGEDANRHVERVEQPALDVRDVGQVEQRQHQRWPDNEERQAAGASAMRSKPSSATMISAVAHVKWGIARIEYQPLISGRWRSSASTRLPKTEGLPSA